MSGIVPDTAKGYGLRCCVFSLAERSELKTENRRFPCMFDCPAAEVYYVGYCDNRGQRR
jgi:hypothetical protein